MMFGRKRRISDGFPESLVILSLAVTLISEITGGLIKDALSEAASLTSGSSDP